MEQDQGGFPVDMTVGGTEDTVAKTVGSRLWLGNLVQQDFKQYLFRICFNIKIMMVLVRTKNQS